MKKKNIVRAIEILKYVYGGMKVPEEKVQVSGAIFHLEMALADQYIYIVCYNDIEDGAINFDVAESKQAALRMIAEWADELENDPIMRGRIRKEYDENGDLTYFALEKEEEVFYECFIRKEKIQ